jgi:hypothetical protein
VVAFNTAEGWSATFPKTLPMSCAAQRFAIVVGAAGLVEFVGRHKIGDRRQLLRLV